MSTAHKLVIAGVCGCAFGVIPYAWGRFQTAKIIVPLSGQVLLDGRPLADAYVKFSPIPRPGQSPLDTNPGSHGFTDDDGCFTLLQIENDRPGVIVGEHRILMRTAQLGSGPDGLGTERVPGSWRSGVRKYQVSWSVRQTVFHIHTIDMYSPQSPATRPPPAREMPRASGDESVD